MTRATRPGGGTILLKIPEVARRLSLSTRQVHRLIRQGHLHSVHIGSASRVREDELNTYIESLSHDPFRAS